MKEELKETILSYSNIYKRETRLFLEFLETGGSDLTVTAVREYAEHLKSSGFAAGTVNSRLSIAKSLFRWVFSRTEEGLDKLAQYRIEEELKDIRGLKQRPRGVDMDKCLSRRETQKLIRKSPSRLSLIVRFMVGHGIRVSEMINIRITWLKDEGTYYSIRVIGKGGKERLLKVDPKLIRNIQDEFGGKTYLFETTGGNRFTRQYVSNSIKDIGRRILNRKISAHTLRHTFATLQLYDRGVLQEAKVKSVSMYMGHSSVSTTMDLYVHTQLSLRSLGIRRRGNAE